MSLPTFRLPLRLGSITSRLFGLGTRQSFRFQTGFRGLDLCQPVFTPLQLIGQFVAATAAQSGVLFGVGAASVRQKLIDLRFQAGDFLFHIALYG